MLAELTQEYPDIDLCEAHWMVHARPFSTPEGTTPETFHEVPLVLDDGEHTLDAVRQLDADEVDELINTLNLRPVEESLQSLENL